MSELFKFSKVLIAAICSFKIVDDKPVQKDTPNNAGVFWLPISKDFISPYELRIGCYASHSVMV